MTDKEKLIKKKENRLEKLKIDSDKYYDKYTRAEDEIDELTREIYELKRDCFNIVGKCFKYEKHYNSGITSARYDYIYVTGMCKQDFKYVCNEVGYRTSGNDEKVVGISFEVDTENTINPDLSSNICIFPDDRLVEISKEEYDHVLLYLIANNPPTYKKDIKL